MRTPWTIELVRAQSGLRDHEFIEHYLPVGVAGTTVNNCVPACKRCNTMKDVKISFHVHEYKKRSKIAHNLCGIGTFKSPKITYLKSACF